MHWRPTHRHAPESCGVGWEFAGKQPRGRSAIVCLKLKVSAGCLTLLAIPFAPLFPQAGGLLQSAASEGAAVVPVAAAAGKGGGGSGKKGK